jgi:hypothetical protein
MIAARAPTDENTRCTGEDEGGAGQEKGDCGVKADCFDDP